MRCQHRSGLVLPDRLCDCPCPFPHYTGLNWMRCTDCGRDWAEKDSGAFAKGSKVCPAVKEKRKRT